MIFCDTSAAAKLYVSEKDSRVVQRRLEAEDRVCLSELARVELMSVFHRQWREKRWTQAELLEAIRQFSSDDFDGFWTWLPLDAAILEASAKTYVALPKAIFLRSSDCIHLVTARYHQFTEILTYDSHQTTAASALGLEVISA